MSEEPSATTEPTTEPATTPETPEATPAATGDEGNGDGGGSGPSTVPEARLSKVVAERNEARKKLEKFEKAEREAADAQAKAAGDVTTAQSERDKANARAEAAETVLQEQLESQLEAMDKAKRAKFDELAEDLPIAKKLALAALTLDAKEEVKTQPKVGGAPGGGAPASGGLLPPELTTWAEYYAWNGVIQMSKDPKVRDILVDPKKAAAIEQEAKARFG